MEHIEISSNKKIGDVEVTNSIKIPSTGADTETLGYIMDKLGMIEQKVEVKGNNELFHKDNTAKLDN